MNETYSFGEWIGQRRKMLDMPQRELAARTNCALATIKKIEGDERKPSRELAELMANALRIPPEAREIFIECARGVRPVDALANLGAKKTDAKSVSKSSGDAINLPAQLTPFIGRDRELAEIADSLNDSGCRLLTLVGQGGIGKTRLAIEAARNAQTFGDGVIFVPLATTVDAALIPGAIAHSLRLTLSDLPEVQLVAYLRTKNMLLILDNCEQFGDGITWLSELLAAAPGIKILATSREPLQLAEEWLYRVGELGESQALALFDQTARRMVRDFDLAGQRAAVITICKLVENLPLAIELAAGWVSFMSCQQIAEHIQRDINFLAANVRNIPERHRSVRAVFDYSWKLLSPDEQAALMRLSVFRGGWSAEEAEKIARANLSLLRTLADKSLVQITGEGRYDLHELTRQYAAEKLREAGVENEVHRKHAEVYKNLAEILNKALEGPQAIAAFARLDQEHDNLRAALTWMLDSGEDEQARQLVDTMGAFWLRRGYWQEGERWAAASLARTDQGESIFICRTLTWRAIFAGVQGHYDEAAPYNQRSIWMARRLQDPETLAKALLLMAQAVPLTAAPAVFDELLAIWSEMGTNWNTGLLANSHNLYGDRLSLSRRYPEAAAHFQKSLEFFRQIGEVDMIAYPLGNLGRLALREGRYREAYDYIAESVAISRAIGNRVGIADWLQQLGNTAFALGELDQAEDSYEEAMALYEEIGNVRAQSDMLACLGHVALVRGETDTAFRNFRATLSAYLEFYRRMTTFIVEGRLWLPAEFFDCLHGMALTEARQGHDERAVTLFGSAEMLTRQIDYRGESQLHSKKVDEAIHLLRTQVSETDFQAAWDKGGAMSLEQVLIYALE